MRDLLTEDGLAAALRELPLWTGDLTRLERRAQLPSFRAGITVVDRVADAAEELNHHPDIDIRFTTLLFRLTTHSAGGVTELDVALAHRIEANLAAARART